MTSIPDPTSFEAHVTIEPVFDSRFLEFERICTIYRFKPAELLLQKQRRETAERSSRDSFCTGHGTDFNELKATLERLVVALQGAGFKIWRYKIEGILLDVRMPRIFNIQAAGG